MLITFLVMTYTFQFKNRISMYFPPKNKNNKQLYLEENKKILFKYLFKIIKFIKFYIYINKYIIVTVNAHELHFRIRRTISELFYKQCEFLILSTVKSFYELKMHVFLNNILV